MLKVASAAIQCQMNKAANLVKFLHCIDEAADHGANILVLPEQSLQGYLTSVVAMDCSGDLNKNEFLYQWENAEEVPDGPSVQTIIRKAMERKIFVCFGMTEKADDYKLYNTAVLTGPDGYIGKYRKVHQPADEMQAYYAGCEFPVFDTPIGRIGMVICYDAWFPEAGRELALGGAEIILKPTATCHASPTHDLLHDQGYYSYDLCERASALHNGCWFISANQIGICGASDYFGHGNIIDPTGHILATTGDQETIVYHEIDDLKRSIWEGRECSFSGLYFLKDRRPSAYRRLTEENTYCNNK